MENVTYSSLVDATSRAAYRSASHIRSQRAHKYENQASADDTRSMIDTRFSSLLSSSPGQYFDRAPGTRAAGSPRPVRASSSPSRSISAEVIIASRRGGPRPIAPELLQKLFDVVKRDQAKVNHSTDPPPQTRCTRADEHKATIKSKADQKKSDQRQKRDKFDQPRDTSKEISKESVKQDDHTKLIRIRGKNGEVAYVRIPRNLPCSRTLGNECKLL